jgi:glyoxylase-like metal-dependent hydrolase (beta-lactamase superfamily II)
MDFRILPVTPFEQNCTLLWCERTRRVAIVDPGGGSELILDLIGRLALVPECILLTHGHIDHVGATGTLAPRLGVPIIGPHRDDRFLIHSLPAQCQLFGFPAVPDFEPDRWLVDGDRVTVGEQVLSVIHCPGHTPGHVVFFDPQARLAQVGDVLFHGSIGRTDFPRGNYEQLIASITERLFPLGDDVRFVPGHGPMSTLGAERRENPYVGERAIARRHI